MDDTSPKHRFSISKPDMGLLRQLCAEALGSFILGTAVTMISAKDVGAAYALAVGTVVVVMTYGYGPLSGGHFNGALSTAMWLMGRLDLTHFLTYLVAQFAGALVGGAFGNFLSTHDSYVPGKATGTSNGTAFFAELMWTAALCYVYLHCTQTKGQKGNSFYGFAIGNLLVDAGSSTVFVSGVFNPTLILGVALVADKGSADVASIVGPLVGAVVGVLAFALTAPTEFRGGLSEKKVEPYINAGIPKYATEFFGTMFLCFTAIFAGGNPGITLMSFVYAGGYISGAHYNPAVTVAHMVRKLQPIKEGIIFIIVQLVAGLLGGIFAYAISDTKVLPAGWETHNDARIFFAEFVFTVLLVTTVLCVASKRFAGNQYYGIAIGFTVVASGHIIGSVSGGVLNPAVGLALCTHTKDGKAKLLWVFFVAPLLAGVVGAFMDLFFHPNNHKESDVNGVSKAPLLGDANKV